MLSDCDYHMFVAMHMHIFEKVAWNHSVDVDALLKEFYRSMFEPAVEEMCKVFAKRQELFCHELEKIPELKFIRPFGAFYVFADISAYGLDSTAFCNKLMEEAHIKRCD